MDFMKANLFYRHNTMHQTVYAFLMAITCNIIWLILRHFRPSPLVSVPEQNSKIIETMIPPYDMTPQVSYATTRPEQRTTTVLIPQLKPREETMQRRQSYFMPLGTPVTQELKPKWAKYKDVIHRL